MMAETRRISLAKKDERNSARHSIGIVFALNHHMN
jgi:hypothetical protein